VKQKVLKRCLCLTNESLSFWAKINKTQKDSDSCGFLALQSAAPGIGYQPEKLGLFKAMSSQPLQCK
jgi:hypothetical protein